MDTGPSTDMEEMLEMLPEVQEPWTEIAIPGILTSCEVTSLGISSPCRSFSLQMESLLRQKREGFLFLEIKDVQYLCPTIDATMFL